MELLQAWNHCIVFHKFDFANSNIVWAIFEWFWSALKSSYSYQSLVAVTATICH